MNRTLKLILYATLVTCVLWFSYAFYREYAKVAAPAPETVSTDAGGSEKVGAINFNERSKGKLSTYGALLFAAVAGLGLLLAHDISQFFGARVQDFVFNDNLQGMKDPAYEEAEHVWANGRHLEAIQLMRDYLKKHPREQYVALRIAEIYENDLGNYLAAALEYQEILKKKLPPERWGWAAIHLANIYSGKLNKQEDATALLQRIAEEYGQTAAAKKARERLDLPEPLPAAPAAAEQARRPTEPEPNPPASNLPPGFRPK